MSLLMVIVVLSNIAPYKYGHVKIPVFIDGHFKLRWYSVTSNYDVTYEYDGIFHYHWDLWL